MARPRKFERDDLLEKALELFWEKGYEATSVHDLGERMGIHPGSLFNTFGDKRKLFYEALGRYEERAREMLFSVFDSPIPKREALETLFATTLAFLLRERAAGRRGCFMVNSLMECCALDPDMDNRAKVNLARLEAVLYRAVCAATEGGEMPPRPDEELHALARSLMANLVAIRVLARVGAEPAVLEDIAQVALSALGT